jgi:hypothetical protein
MALDFSWNSIDTSLVLLVVIMIGSALVKLLVPAGTFVETTLMLFFALLATGRLLVNFGVHPWIYILLYVLVHMAYTGAQSAIPSAQESLFVIPLLTCVACVGYIPGSWIWSKLQVGRIVKLRRAQLK